MKRFPRRAVLVAAISIASVALPGCKKKPVAASSLGVQTVTPAAAASAAKLNGANEVITDIDSKRYDDAVRLLAQIRQSVATDDQKTQYLILMSEAKNKLIDASSTDPNAAPALAAVRSMIMGR